MLPGVPTPALTKRFPGSPLGQRVVLSGGLRVVVDVVVQNVIGTGVDGDSQLVGGHLTLREGGLAYRSHLARGNVPTTGDIPVKKLKHISALPRARGPDSAGGDAARSRRRRAWIDQRENDGIVFQRGYRDGPLVTTTLSAYETSTPRVVISGVLLASLAGTVLRKETNGVPSGLIRQRVVQGQGLEGGFTGLRQPVTGRDPAAGRFGAGA